MLFKKLTLSNFGPFKGNHELNLEIEKDDKPIILIVEPNGNLIEKINPEGWTIKELVDWGSDFGYEFIGTSGHVGKHSGNVYLIREDCKDKFDICKKPWLERGILLPEGIIY